MHSQRRYHCSFKKLKKIRGEGRNRGGGEGMGVVGVIEVGIVVVLVLGEWGWSGYWWWGDGWIAKLLAMIHYNITENMSSKLTSFSNSLPCSSSRGKPSIKNPLVFGFLIISSRKSSRTHSCARYETCKSSLPTSSTSRGRSHLNSHCSYMNQCLHLYKMKFSMYIVYLCNLKYSRNKSFYGHTLDTSSPLSITATRCLPRSDPDSTSARSKSPVDK